MTYTVQTEARLHEHAGSVAVRIGEGETVYLTPELAEKLAKELGVAAVRVAGGHAYKTTNIRSG